MALNDSIEIAAMLPNNYHSNEHAVFTLPDVNIVNDISLCDLIKN